MNQSADVAPAPPFLPHGRLAERRASEARFTDTCSYETLVAAKSAARSLSPRFLRGEGRGEGGTYRIGPCPSPHPSPRKERGEGAGPAPADTCESCFYESECEAQRLANAPCGFRIEQNASLLALQMQGASSWTPAPAAITRSTRAGSATRWRSGRRPRRRSTGSSRRKTVFDRRRRRLRPLVRRRRLQHLLERGRPPRDARPRRAGGDHLRFAAGRARSATITYDRAAGRDAGARRASCADFGVEQGRPRHPLHADGAGGADRHARLRAHRRGPFGGVRRLRARRSSRPASTTPSRRSILSASCGIEPGRVVPYKPLLDEAIELATHKPRRLPDPAAPAVRGGADRRAAITTGRASARRGDRVRQARCTTACRSRATDPLYILYTSGTTGTAERRGARQRRPHGRARNGR